MLTRAEIVCLALHAQMGRTRVLTGAVQGLALESRRYDPAPCACRERLELTATGAQVVSSFLVVPRNERLTLVRISENCFQTCGSVSKEKSFKTDRTRTRLS